MSIGLIAGTSLLLGLFFCLACRRSIATDRSLDLEPGASIAVGTTPAPAQRDYTTISTNEWALAAQRVGLDELLATRPGVIRRVAAE